MLKAFFARQQPHAAQQSTPQDVASTPPTIAAPPTTAAPPIVATAAPPGIYAPATLAASLQLPTDVGPEVVPPVLAARCTNDWVRASRVGRVPTWFSAFVDGLQASTPPTNAAPPTTAAPPIAATAAPPGVYAPATLAASLQLPTDVGPEVVPPVMAARCTNDWQADGSRESGPPVQAAEPSIVATKSTPNTGSIVTTPPDGTCKIVRMATQLAPIASESDVAMSIVAAKSPNTNGGSFVAMQVRVVRNSRSSAKCAGPREFLNTSLMTRVPTKLTMVAKLTWLAVHTPFQRVAALSRPTDGSRKVRPVMPQLTGAPQDDGVPPHATHAERRAVPRVKKKKVTAARLARGRDTTPSDAAPGVTLAA